jgi:hypothetical protein
MVVVIGAAYHHRNRGRRAAACCQSRRRIVSSISSPRPGAKSRLTPTRRNPAFSRTRSDPGVVRGRAGEQWAFADHAEKTLQRRTGDTLTPQRPIDPRSVGIDDALQDTRVIAQTRHAGKKRVTPSTSSPKSTGSPADLVGSAVRTPTPPSPRRTTGRLRRTQILSCGAMRSATRSAASPATASSAVWVAAA